MTPLGVAALVARRQRPQFFSADKVSGAVVVKVEFANLANVYADRHCSTRKTQSKEVHGCACQKSGRLGSAAFAFLRRNEATVIGVDGHATNLCRPLLKRLAKTLLNLAAGHANPKPGEVRCLLTKCYEWASAPWQNDGKHNG